MKPAPPRRLVGLDQTRAVAILAMLAAHFAPGVFIQFPQLEPIQSPVLWFARLATPTFVVVFGVTTGFALLPRYLRGESRATDRRLRRRGAVMLLCAAVVAVPAWIRLATEREANPWAWAFGAYSVLLFYALALVVLPAWLGWLTRPGARLGVECTLAGVGLWAIGAAAEAVWPQRPPSLVEFTRMMLVSGSFPYCQMMGVAIVAIPVGYKLRQRWQAGTDGEFLGSLLVSGIALAVGGGLWGWAVGEYDPARILSGDLRVPARAWYFLHLGGAGLTLIPAMELLTRAVPPLRPVGYLLALFGQGALVIYTGHALVLPGLALADEFVPLFGAGRVAAALIPFALFCAVVMYDRHRRPPARASVRVRRIEIEQIPSASERRTPEPSLTFGL